MDSVGITKFTQINLLVSFFSLSPSLSITPLSSLFPPPPPPPHAQPHHLSNCSEADSDEDGATLGVCPDQKFQVSELLLHLLASLALTNHVLLQPYLASWDELIKFMEALGLMVGLISQEIESKTSIIRDLALRKATSSRGLVDFRQTTDSGCRTLLRLHRALLWLQGFLE
uniref:Glycolipid transfer protein domain containing 2b n=1 Tax=Hucho hucho TaxID=62062 RepID=A0A4W5LS28_9TELE